ncbi:MULTISPECIES: trimethoprim-resistant dihydrofolate reductase DfrA6 [Bacteria]|uniref:dihydrofolate reductase n=1 Tax=Corynebacterium lemuris TaxID=1859292 RepID=A0ABT2G0E7_9CORY|nr:MULTISPECIES: trimethoprim-resistant dihydrofolate reductase DfrA6 [Bacteria]MCS5480975.1 trimethoprim-resistant dihydrofolate reductase DfrA6 [Corynebacterium lemuris]MDM1755859.1 trimethoprim-resistant dihydrofolate reductase DfrA [Acinetobacter towneri]WKH88809.1 trimethoprim-resistant dihydrofolate reductase DfrA6 [Klebsiella pneumoniae]WNO61618.1 trimethoprim-resistant dihydrofolate reductase DfrA6 [Rheinheimera sp. MMS21-TC3]
MKISLMAAVSENGVIGSGLDIPWHVQGEQLLFKAMTYNQWLLVGRKTFDSMGKLPNRKYAVVTRSKIISNDPDVVYFASVESALAYLNNATAHIFVSGGGEIYEALIDQADVIHLSVIHKHISGDVFFPPVPQGFKQTFEQSFSSNIDYTYQIWAKG